MTKAKKPVEPLVEVPACPFATTVSPLDYGDIITVKANKDTSTREFRIHEGLLTHFSGYFRGALKNHWIEGQAKIIQMDVEEVVLEMFYCWLYSKKLYFSSPKGDADADIPLDFEDIVDAYIFADVQVIPQFGNATLDLLFQKVTQRWKFPWWVLDVTYEKTTEYSKLRQFLVNNAADAYNFGGMRENKHCYPRDFLVDVIERLKDQSIYPGQRADKDGDKYVQQQCKGMCKYHDHSNLEKVGAPTND
ncbi:hypothetical protein BCR34DRAFT_587217 [Clohesyomyces aquaticus]|uniref:BTB domain-containing protein n=1 Tax=Clohesyomyces aquaticus TaxID=1231657 RepID=A0A1Y1ZQ96_9PLEO|nr:hypothetical protein BCR34DRAFT_587217 [Clohesyomyces aquaticus]